MIHAILLSSAMLLGAHAELQLNVMTDAEQAAVGSPQAGMIVWDSSDTTLAVYNGSAWVDLAATDTRSYALRTPAGSSGTYYTAGYYDLSSTDANLNQGSTTVTWGTANHPHGAHAILVSGGNGTTDGSDLVVTVTGISITDEGVRNDADSEVIVATATSSAADTYYETSRKWLGSVTYTLSSTGGGTFAYDFNYGYSKYEDFGNIAFTVNSFECTWTGGATDTGIDWNLVHHDGTGWTYSAAAFVGPVNDIVRMTTDYGVNNDQLSGEDYAYKRSALSQAVDGSGSEGVVIELTTTANAAIQQASCHIGVFRN